MKKKKERSSMLFSQVIGNSPVVLYNYNQEDYIRKGYSSNAEVYSILTKITDKANASIPYVYIDKEGVKFKKSRKDSVFNIAKHRLNVYKALEFAPEDNDLSELLKRPNPMQTWNEFSTLMRIFYFAQGEAFVYREAGDDDCAISLHIVPAHLMSQVITNDELVGWKLNQFGRVREFELNDVMHFKKPNPNFDGQGGQVRGMSPLMAGLKYLQLDDKSMESWIRMMDNEGAKGLISPNHNNVELWLTPEQVSETEKSVDEKIHGSNNRNRVVVSGMPLQYTHIGLSPDALNIINGLDKAGVKLCDLWNVPSVLFDPNPTYQNLQEGRKRFVMDVILPYLNAEEDKLNQWLVEPFRKRDNKEYLIDYDLSVYEELALDLDGVEKMLKTHTINEVRVMQGSDEREETYANEIFINQGMIPLSDYDVEI
ncbi:MAG: phage portal protein [Proteiniphilum sp.]